MNEAKEHVKMSARVLYWVAFIAVVVGGSIFVYTKYMAPHVEDNRRAVYDNSRAYVQGQIQQLNQWNIEYQKAEKDAQKQAIRSAVLNMLADFDESKLPPHLQQFVNELRASY